MRRRAERTVLLMPWGEFCSRKYDRNGCTSLFFFCFASVSCRPGRRNRIANDATLVLPDVGEVDVLALGDGLARR
eukprot:scaffold89395_cov29-Phaeocystis_antarctica.AAC.1